jgi:peptide/nickel transport system permease protein/oligopeptide transport system permease protein
MSDQMSASILGTTAPAGPEVEPPPGTPGAERSASLWADAWRQLIRNPVFIIAGVIILTVASMAVFPQLWTSQNPAACDVRRSRIGPTADHPFGFDLLGCDYYAFNVYGARPSLMIAVGATIGIVLVGGVIGLLAGYYGGWVDAILSRIMDVFFSLPFLLGAIVFLAVVQSHSELAIMSVLVVLGWTTVARVMRGSVLSAKGLDYVQAARALGASNSRLMFRHILPNAVAPVVVLATIALGGFVSAEATLTFLGVGLIQPDQSWGIAINTHQVYFLEHPWLLAFPVALLVGTVLSFILMGDALRDALDPKLR